MDLDGVPLFGHGPSAQAVSFRQQLCKEQIPQTSLQMQRDTWESAARAMPLAPGTRAFDEVICGVPCVWIKTGQSPDRADCVLYAHGGGLVTGSAVTHLEFGSRLARGLNRTVLLVDYRLLPENAFPAPLLDVLLVYSELVAGRGLPASRLVFGGDSSGAALILAALQVARELDYPLPRKAFLISGAFDASLSGVSMHDSSVDDPLLDVEVLVDWQRRYLGDPKNLQDPPLSPLFGRMDGLPPLLLQVGENEIWRSDSIALANQVRERNGRVELQVWPGMWHCWPMYGELPDAAAAIGEVARFLDE